MTKHAQRWLLHWPETKRRLPEYNFSVLGFHNIPDISLRTALIDQLINQTAHAFQFATIDTS
jgi:hypothetical protein